MNINQQPHELRNGDGGMCVVELNGHFFSKGPHVPMMAYMTLNQVLQRRRRKKILLTQSQLLSRRSFIARVKYQGDRVSACASFKGAYMIALVEGG